MVSQPPMSLLISAETTCTTTWITLFRSGFTANTWEIISQELFLSFLSYIFLCCCAGRGGSVLFILPVAAGGVRSRGRCTNPQCRASHCSRHSTRWQPEPGKHRDTQGSFALDTIPLPTPPSHPPSAPWSYCWITESYSEELCQIFF